MPTGQEAPRRTSRTFQGVPTMAGEPHHPDVVQEIPAPQARNLAFRGESSEFRPVFLRSLAPELGSDAELLRFRARNRLR